MMKKVILLGALLGLSFAFAQAPVLAMGDGGTTDTSAQKCKKGEVWDKKKKKCVKAAAGVIPDEDLYQQGRGLAKEGEYEWALTVLAAVSDQKDPRVLNYTGYSYRKLGQLEKGIGYYEQALAIDPNYVLVREYLGEGYVAAGKVDLAKAQLVEIASRCGKTCEEYEDLAEAISHAAD
jgi:tetratricopeptide (TPR) repeat protein